MNNATHHIPPVVCPVVVRLTPTRDAEGTLIFAAGCDDMLALNGATYQVPLMVRPPDVCLHLRGGF